MVKDIFRFRQTAQPLTGQRRSKKYHKPSIQLRLNEARMQRDAAFRAVEQNPNLVSGHPLPTIIPGLPANLGPAAEATTNLQPLGSSLFRSAGSGIVGGTRLH